MRSTFLHETCGFIWPMGNKSNGRASSNKAVSRIRFPLGELANRRKELKEKYLAQNSKLKDLQKDVQKRSKKVCKFNISGSNNLMADGTIHSKLF